MQHECSAFFLSDPFPSSSLPLPGPSSRDSSLRSLPLIGPNLSSLLGIRIWGWGGEGGGVTSSPVTSLNCLNPKPATQRPKPPSPKQTPNALQKPGGLKNCKARLEKEFEEMATWV